MHENYNDWHGYEDKPNQFRHIVTPEPDADKVPNPSKGKDGKENLKNIDNTVYQTKKLVDLPRNWSFEAYKNKYTDDKKVINDEDGNILEVLNG